MVPIKLLPARVNQHVAIVRVNSTVADPYFVLCCINSPQYKHHLLTLAQGGATREALTKDTISNFEILLPPLHTQRKIATILGAYDDLIENNTRRIQILEEMTQALYHEWFVNFWFPGHENVKMVESELGLVPEGWEVKNVADFGWVLTGKTPSKKQPEFYGNDIPFIKTPDMHGNLFVLETVEYLSAQGAASQSGKTLPPNSLCVSCIGTVGIVSITSQPSQTNQQINSIVLEEINNREFLYFTLKDLRETIKRYASTGATMANLSKGKFEALRVVYPAGYLLDAFCDKTAHMFELVKSLQRGVAILRRTRDLLLPKLISGEVDVSNLEIETEALIP